MQRTGLWALLVLFLLAVALPAGAQDGQNLLRDGSFEGQYTGRGRSDFNIPADWNAWVGASQPSAFPHLGPDPDPQDGRRAFNMNKGYEAFTAAIFQQVAVPEGANVRGSAYAWLHTCNVPDGREKCASSSEFNAFVKVGIDPNGGTNPNDSDIVWTQAAPHDVWQEVSVDATATAGTVTLFLYVSQQTGAQLNKVYFDTAKLTVGGGGGAAPGASGSGGGSGSAAPAPPPPPAYAPAVNPQDASDDGSIVHVVQPGDTIDAIAVAYGVTRADILALNNISDPRIIAIGQELTIREGSGSGDADDEEGSESTDEGGDESEGEDDTGDDEAEEPRASSGVSPEDAPSAPVVSVASGNVLPRRDPAAMTSLICVMLFDDANQNRIQEDGEALLQGGVISMRNEGEEVESYTTDGVSEPHCFTDLTAGNYVAVANPPQGYGLTTPNQFLVRANPGGTISLAFGAAEGVLPVMVPPPDNLIVEDVVEEEPETPRSPITENVGLVVFGLAGIVLLAGTGATLFLRRR